jgi:hypothetical protein
MHERHEVRAAAALRLCHAARADARILALELQAQGISKPHEALEDAMENGPFLLASWTAERTRRRPRG